LLSYIAAGGISSSEPPANPATWLPDKSWGELVRLSADVKGFEGLEQAFRDNAAGFKVTVCQRSLSLMEIKALVA
jgi:hypothetical protein